MYFPKDMKEWAERLPLATVHRPFRSFDYGATGS